ncbi:unnamed protein product [Nesidiocoris tenuis]|uniref:Uncharacterized protein n=1 Tax=Nesidiocoris tenuis TaxID=355587 RepID=A0A6H5GSQ8_9HEMI|nr:unnamed protein product [Nesidiocoris tenuis]
MPVRECLRSCRKIGPAVTLERLRFQASFGTSCKIGRQNLSAEEVRILHTFTCKFTGRSHLELFFSNGFYCSRMLDSVGVRKVKFGTPCIVTIISISAFCIVGTEVWAVLRHWRQFNEACIYLWCMSVNFKICIVRFSTFLIQTACKCCFKADRLGYSAVDRRRTITRKEEGDKNADVGRNPYRTGHIDHHLNITWRQTCFTIGIKRNRKQFDYQRVKGVINRFDVPFFLHIRRKKDETCPAYNDRDGHIKGMPRYSQAMERYNFYQLLSLQRLEGLQLVQKTGKGLKKRFPGGGTPIRNFLTRPDLARWLIFDKVFAGTVRVLQGASRHQGRKVGVYVMGLKVYRSLSSCPRYRPDLVKLSAGEHQNSGRHECLNSGSVSGKGWSPERGGRCNAHRSEDFFLSRAAMIPKTPKKRRRTYGLEHPQRARRRKIRANTPRGLRSVEEPPAGKTDGALVSELAAGAIMLKTKKKKEKNRGRWIKQKL